MKLRLKEILKKQGRQTRWVAKQLGVTSSAVRQWKRNDRRPTYDIIVKLAKLLNVTTDELIER